MSYGENKSIKELFDISGQIDINLAACRARQPSVANMHRVTMMVILFRWGYILKIKRIFVNSDSYVQIDFHTNKYPAEQVK